MSTLSSFWLIYHQYCDENQWKSCVCVSLCVLRMMRLTWPIGSWYIRYICGGISQLPCRVRASSTRSASNRCQQICRAAQLGEGHKRPRFPIRSWKEGWPEKVPRDASNMLASLLKLPQTWVGPWYWFISVCEGRPLRSTLFVVDSRHV